MASLTEEARRGIATELLKNEESASALARRIGVHRQTVVKLRTELLEAGFAAVFGQGGSPAPIPAPAAPKVRADESLAVASLKDELTRLRSALRRTQRERLDDDAMAKVLGVAAGKPTCEPEWLVRRPAGVANSPGEVPVLTWADWHLGETVDPEEVGGVNAYNMEIAEARVRRLVDNTIRLCSEDGPKRYPGAVLNLAGDFVSGGLHAELLKTDELEILPTALRARDLLVWGIKRIRDAFGQVYVACAAGNHGRMTHRPEFKRYVYKNADWLIYQLLKKEFEGDPRVIIDVRSTNEVNYQVYGHRFCLMHGDMLGVKGGDGIIGAIGPIIRGEVKTRGQLSTIGKDYDTLIIGHWHQQLWLPRVMVSNTLKGYDEFARLALRVSPTPPSQPLFFVHHKRGITSRWDIRVEDTPERAKEWVKWESFEGHLSPAP